ncbi:hypothetical protein BJY04DRAFT_214142 [Aspergillus karnatakaensis]|uniref:uncharacterized protein n=1 Tax=Aspergillus karnatakaensis TaxID=1810916 RepID=UPI003CCCAA99
MNTTQGFFPPQAQAGRSIFNFSQSTSTVAIQTPTPRPSPVSVQSNCRAPMDQPPPATSTIADSFSSAGSSLPLSSSHDGMVPQCSAVASQSSNSPAGSAAGPTARPTSRDEFVIEQVRRSAQAVTDYIQSEKKDRETILTRLARLEANSPKYSTILNTQKTALDALTQSKDADVAALTRQLEKQGIEIQLLRVANTARDNEFTTLKRTVDEHRTEFREWDRSSKEHIATLARKFEDLTEGQIQVCVRFDDLVRRTNDVHSFIRRLRDLDDRPWRSDGAERM